MARRKFTFIINLIKSVLNDPNVDMSYHDACHMTISRLPRILMCGHMVSGIHGVCIPEFGTAHLTPEYSGWLDERRVAIHQVLTTPSLASVCKYIYACVSLIKLGGNPLTITYAHYLSLK